MLRNLVISLLVMGSPVAWTLAEASDRPPEADSAVLARRLLAATRAGWSQLGHVRGASEADALAVRGPTTADEPTTGSGGDATQCPEVTVCPLQTTVCPVQETTCPQQTTVCPVQETICPTWPTLCEYTVCPACGPPSAPRLSIADQRISPRRAAESRLMLTVVP